jgi:Fe-S cluster biogenesis protein NfuA
MHVEGVPNPHARRFVLENGLLVDEPYEFLSYKEADLSPLAKKLLMLRYVDRVLLNRNFITILKNPKQSPPWEEITQNLMALIQEHLEQNEPILFVGANPARHQNHPDPLLAVIRNVFDQRIRPAAQEDGGDILIESFENGVLNVSMHGSCHTCPYAAQTIKDGVEALLKHISPEVLSVVALQNNVLK